MQGGKAPSRLNESSGIVTLSVGLAVRAAGAQSSTAMPSISTRKCGSASPATTIKVFAG